MNRIWSLAGYLNPWGGSGEQTKPPKREEEQRRVAVDNKSNKKIEKTVEAFPVEIRESSRNSHSSLSGLLGPGELAELVFTVHAWEIFVTYSPSPVEILRALATRPRPTPVAISWMSVVIKNSPPDVWYGRWSHGHPNNKQHFVAAFPEYLNFYSMVGGDTSTAIFKDREADISLKDYCLNKVPSLQSQNPLNPENVEASILLDEGGKIPQVFSSGAERCRVRRFMFNHFKCDVFTIGNISSSLSELEKTNKLSLRRIEELCTSFIWDVLKAFCVDDLSPEEVGRFLSHFPKFSEESRIILKHGANARLLFCSQESIQYLIGVNAEMTPQLKITMIDNILSNWEQYEEEVFESNVQTLKEFEEECQRVTNIKVEPEMFYLPDGEISFYVDGDTIRFRLRERELCPSIPRAPIKKVLEVLTSCAYQRKYWED